MAEGIKIEDNYLYFIIYNQHLILSSYMHRSIQLSMISILFLGPILLNEYMPLKELLTHIEVASPILSYHKLDFIT